MEGEVLDLCLLTLEADNATLVAVLNREDDGNTVITTFQLPNKNGAALKLIIMIVRFDGAK